MATKATKEKYRIDASLATGNWLGRCPTCFEVFEATDVSVSQAGVIASIQKHEREEHGK